MKTRSKLSPGSILKSNPQATLKYILLTGSMIGLAISFFLIQSDIDKLNRSPLSLLAQFESEEIKTGEKVSLIYTLSGMIEDQEEEVDFFAELPSNFGFKYVANSFRILDGKWEAISIDGDENSSIFTMQGLALNEGEGLRFSIDVEIPKDLNLIGKELDHTAHCTIGQNTYPVKSSPIIIDWNSIQAEKVVVEPNSGGISDGLVTYEVRLKNPANGISFEESSYLISFSELIEDKAVSIDPGSIKFLDGSQRGEILTRNNRLIIQNLNLQAGENINFQYSVRLPRHYAFVEDIKCTSKIMVPGTNILQHLKTSYSAVLP